MSRPLRETRRGLPSRRKASARTPSHLTSKIQSGERNGLALRVASMGWNDRGSGARAAPGSAAALSEAGRWRGDGAARGRAGAGAALDAALPRAEPRARALPAAAGSGAAEDSTRNPEMTEPG